MSRLQKERPFNLLLQYTYSHLYFFRWVTKKSYRTVCDVCGYELELNAEGVESKSHNSAIPFMTRFGWLFLVASVLIAFIAIGIAVS